MPTLRQLHRYLGVFFTPAILFFAFSGALQTLGLHEGAVHGAAPPYPWIATIAALHKDQHLPKRRASPPQAIPVAAAPPVAESHDAVPPAAPQPSALPLKLFVLALAAGLCLSSLTGMYLALANPRTRVASGATLAAGAVLPLLLLLFG